MLARRISCVWQVALAAGWGCSQAPAPPLDPSCEEGLTACGSDCVDLARSLDHCGDCGVVCDDASACFLGTCTQFGALQLAREGHQALLASDGRIYVFGGLTAENRAAKEVEVYEPGTNRWRVVTQMTNPRPYLSVAERDGAFWTMGGYDFPTEVLGDVEIWDPTRGWSGGAPLSHLRTDAAVTTVRSQDILLIGGNDGNGDPDGVFYPRNMDVFDGTSWRIAAAPRSTWGARAVTLRDGRVLLVGGFIAKDERGQDEHNAHLYDPLTQSWSEAAPLVPNRSIGAAMLGPYGRVYYAGGSEGDDPQVGVPSARVDAYDPDTNTWSEVEPLPDVRVDCSGVATPDGQLLVIGGAAGPVQSGATSDVVLTFDFKRNVWF